jgi:hypothetical protein
VYRLRKQSFDAARIEQRQWTYRSGFHGVVVKTAVATECAGNRKRQRPTPSA